ncbi:MAG: serine/threonine protein kinase [Planctomycetes bacterium]|nr:serine/threonine protein kinase [Planctomycetota bacterium]
MTFQDVLATITAQGLGGVDPGLTIRPPDAEPNRDQALLRPLTLDGAQAEFEVRGLLGEGGMGRVDLAVQRSLQREVAIKRPRGEGEASNALIREALLTGSLAHPSIVPVYELGHDVDQRPVLVMERIQGRSWQELVGTDASCGDALRRHLEILIQVCNALHFAHSHQVVHRDVKLDNVMVGEFGEVYLVDWGIALRLQEPITSDAVVGTPAYMAPEMLDGEAAVTPLTDVYLLGATLHRLITGSSRHSGTLQSAIRSVCQSLSVDYENTAPGDLAALCNQATAKDPAERPESALAFRQALERYLEHQGSRELSDRAEACLSELEAELEADTPDSDLVATLTAQARFGFEEALRSYPGSEEARRGLQRCLELSIEVQLEARNKGLVEALLGALPTPRPDLEQRLDELKERIDAEGDRLRQLEHDQDLELHANQRASFLIKVGVISGGFQAVTAFTLYKGWTALSHGSVALFNAGLLFLFVGVFHFLRERLLPTVASRRLAWSMAAMLAALQTHHLFGYLKGHPVEEVIASNDLLLLVGFAVLGITLDKRLFVLLPLLFAMGLASTLAPSWTVLYQAIGTFLGFVLWAYVTTRPSETKPEPATPS